MPMDDVTARGFDRAGAVGTCYLTLALADADGDDARALEALRLGRQLTLESIRDGYVHQVVEVLATELSAMLRVLAETHGKDPVDMWAGVRQQEMAERARLNADGSDPEDPT